MVRIRFGNEETHLSWEEWEARVRAGRVPADTPVCVEALTGSAFVPAGDLESYRQLRDDAALRWRGQLRSGPPPIVTALLVGVQIRVWWTGLVPEVERHVMRNWTTWAPPIWEDGESWRLLAMGLAHSGAVHLVLNLIWLAYVGWNLERVLGRRNLLTLYFASVAGGALLSMLGSPWTPSIGASGGIFGLIAAAVVFGWTRPDLLPERGRRVFGWALLPYLLLMLGSGLLSDTTDNWAHIGGLVTGALLAVALDPEPIQRRPRWNASWRLGVAGAIAGLLLVTGLLGPRLHPLVHPDHARIEATAARGEPRPEADPTPHALQWYVPAGWRPTGLPGGLAGFRSPAGERRFAVQERRSDQPVSLEALAEERIATLHRMSGEGLQVSALTPTEVAGLPGLAFTATSAAGLVTEWRGASRGLWSLEELWQVEERRHRRLEPLRDRLRQAITWHEPLELEGARAAVQRAPTSRVARARLAGLLSDVGEVEEALDLYASLLDENPRDVEVRLGLLQVVHTWLPHEAVPVWEEALARHEDRRVVLEVVAGLEQVGRHDDALGLLEVAAGTLTYDRDLRRARRARGLSATPETRPEPGPLTLDEARRRGEVLNAQREERIERARAVIAAGGDPTEALLAVRHPYVHPPSVETGGPALEAELQAVARGQVPSWLPEDLAEALRPTLPPPENTP